MIRDLLTVVAWLILAAFTIWLITNIPPDSPVIPGPPTTEATTIGGY
jgi:hypothetical protein